MKAFFNKIFTGKLWLPAIIVLLFGVNWLAAKFHTGIDFTNEKRFTLSSSTKSLLKGLDSTVNITVLLTGDIKSEFKKLSTSTKELLENFKNYGGKNIQYKFELPGEGMNDSLKAMVFDSLIRMGLRPTNQQVQVKEGEGEGKNQRQIFPGAIIEYKGYTLAIDLLQGQVQKNVFNSNDLLDKESLNSAEALLEYKFASAIQKLTATQIPVVAYVYGNGEPHFGVPFVNDVFETLSKNFIVDTIDIKSAPYIPAPLHTEEHSMDSMAMGYDALVIVKPIEKFTEEDKFKLDQYVMNGGTVVWFIDALYAERDSLQKGNLIAYSRELNLNDLLFKYGVRINNDLIVDKHCDVVPVEVGNIGGQSQKQLLPWPYSPLLQPGSDNPIVKNMADVLGQFANSIDTVDAPGIKKTVLLSSSDNAYTLTTPAQIELNSMQVEEDISKFNRKDIPVAVLLEGTFSSMFANRVSQQQMAELQKNNLPFLKESIGKSKVIVVSDADIVINGMSDIVGPLPMGNNKYTKTTYANRDFFLNCVEYVANKKSILDARAKDYTLRLLDVKKVEEQRTKWQMINLVVPILLVVLFAVIYQWWRKRKYAINR